jgi:uncharacterized beta-barrel protein YwiB (DUF1934 family)
VTDVVISIKSAVETDGDIENMEFNTTGRMSVKDGVCRLYYDEDDGSGNSSAFIKATDDSVTIQRSGEAASRLVVKAGERCVGHYDMGAMGMMVGFTGREVKVSFSEEGADISLVYAVDINAAPISVNSVTIKAELA